MVPQLLTATALFIAGPVSAAAVPAVPSTAAQCDAAYAEYQKATTRWHALSAQDQRRFPSLLSIAVEREADYRACAGLPPSGETLKERYEAVKAAQP